ncbi:11267_t:CDS:2, partial [Acaulospora morrowiae]
TFNTPGFVDTKCQCTQKNEKKLSCNKYLRRKRGPKDRDDRDVNFPLRDVDFPRDREENREVDSNNILPNEHHLPLKGTSDKSNETREDIFDSLLEETSNSHTEHFDPINRQDFSDS